MASREIPGVRDLETETRDATDIQDRLRELRVPCLTILWHPDVSCVGARASLTGLISGNAEGVSRLEPVFSCGDDDPRPLGHPRLSRKPFELSPGTDGGVVLEPGETSTRIEADGELVQGRTELGGAAVERGVVLLLGNRVVLLLHSIDLMSASPRRDEHGMIGSSAPMARLFEEIERVADLDFAVLLRGESGTGKEMVARAIHDASSRDGQPYLAVNVGAIPQTLATSELFGATKGAYSGADRRRQGYFQRADGGTLFLDEIGEAPTEVQVLLLRALESGEIQPVGADDTTTVDVRVVSATDADLEQAVSQERFRAPLLHRLSAYEIRLPPLRERRVDFGRLFLHFLQRELEAVDASAKLDAATDPPYVPAELVARLARFRWPGNVRQLLNVVRQLVIGSRDAETMKLAPAVERAIGESLDGPGEPVERAAATASPVAPPAKEAPPKAKDKSYRQPWEIQTAELLEALRGEGWNVNRTALRLNVSRTTLYKLMDSCAEIRKASELTAEELTEGLAEHGGNIEAMADAFCVSPRGLQLHIKKLGLKLQ